MIIAIDGPAASGKGTLAKRLAAVYGLPHLDTGLLYRGTARAVLDAGGDVHDAAAAVRAAESLDLLDFDEIRLRGKDMGEAASVVAAVPAVRAALVAVQRSFAHREAGAVLDGRDIGTVICPGAHAKIFVVASAEARARRRHLELEGRGGRGGAAAGRAGRAVAGPALRRRADAAVPAGRAAGDVGSADGVGGGVHDRSGRAAP